MQVLLYDEGGERLLEDHRIELASIPVVGDYMPLHDGNTKEERLWRVTRVYRPLYLLPTGVIELATRIYLTQEG